MDNIPDWFYNEIVTGVQKLYALSLSGTPPAETITLTSTVWVETLFNANISWQAELDSLRIQQTFIKLSIEYDRWPAPKHFLLHLVKRPTQKNSHESRLIHHVQQQSIKKFSHQLT